MSKYTFTCEHWDGSRVTFEKEADALSDVLESFEFFLKGSGFYLEGQLDIVPEETESAFDTDDDEDDISFDFGAAQPIVNFDYEPQDTISLNDINFNLDTNVHTVEDNSTIVIK